MSGIVEALTTMPETRIFEVSDDSDDPLEWQLDPVPGDYLPEIEEGFFLLRALHVRPDGTSAPCWIDLSMPERVADYAYFLQGDELQQLYLHEVEGEVISAVPIDAFGDYELFYSRIAPDLGLEVLRAGLEAAPHKAFMAEDLGYILRDEERDAEAAEAFRLSAEEGPSSEYIFAELADCYRRIGETEKAETYQERAAAAGLPDPTQPHKKRWWKRS